MYYAMPPSPYLAEWQRVFRVGVLPQLTRDNLVALRDALQSNDPRLMQGDTTYPPPFPHVLGWPCDRCCLLAFPGLTDGLTTVGELNTFFARMCAAIDAAIGEPAGVRHLLQWYDDQPRAEVFAALVAEIDAALAPVEAA
jgi:hypothetical protein